MEAILNFLPKMQKHKFASISLTMRDRAISSKFSTTGYISKLLFAIFKRFSSLKKWQPFEFFKFCRKMEKHKLASISLIVPDRRILSKFSTPRVSKVYWRLFTKVTFPSLLVAILNFCVKR